MIIYFQICDSNMNIMSVYAHPGGSLSHDTILNQHAVKIDLESLNNSRDLCWLLGMYIHIIINFNKLLGN